MRPAQWTKNIVVLAAWAFAIADPLQPDITFKLSISRCLIPLLLAFGMVGAFCLVSSAFYILNDVNDVDADRSHPVKKSRPVAAGLISQAEAIRGALVLFASGVIFPSFVVMFMPERSLAFGTIMTYTVLQCFYTGLLKKIPYIDVFVIATGFVLRAVAGAAILSARISPWLLLCTFSLSLFLALCKRKSEKRLIDNGCAGHESRPALKNYHPQILNLLIAGSAILTAGIYTAYTISGDTAARFGKFSLTPTALFATLGIVRYLFIVYRSEGGGNPEKILLADKWIWGCLAGYAFSATAAFLKIF